MKFIPSLLKSNLLRPSSLRLAFGLALIPLAVTPAKTSLTGPVRNDAFPVAFKQSIGANEPLRTGSYSATVTFTLSTTQP